MSPTKSGTRKLSDVAAVVVKPGGIRSTGYPQVEATCRDMGIAHDDWQQGLGRLILAKRSDGKYAATVGGIGMSIPRQVGKTFTVGSILFALAIKHPGMLILWTAHRTRTANETFRSMKGMAARSKIKPFVKTIRSVNGEQELEFHGGSRILFGAREQGFGRGFAGVDVIVFDEAQILTDRALEDMIPATNQATHPAGALLFFMGTPPRPTDPGEAFRRMRTEALSGESEDIAWIELSADAEADSDDWRQVAKANPSYPDRTPREAIMRMRKRLGEDAFRREGLGIWDPEDSGGALPVKWWLDLKDAEAERGSEVMFGLDLTGERDVWISVAWRRDDGDVHVMLANDGGPVPAHRAVAECRRLQDAWGGAFAVAALGDELERAGVDFIDVNGPDFAAACGDLEDAILAGSVRHGNQQALNEAVRVAKWRTSLSSGERAFQLKDMPEVGPAAAAVRALWGLENYAPLPAIY